MTRTHLKFAVRSIILLCAAFALVVQAQQSGQNANRGGGGARTRGGFGSTSSGAGNYYPNGQVGEALVSSDPETRRLIVITDEETSQFVGQVVTNLDQPKPQVLINVVFLEATYNNNFDFGVESSYHKNIDGSTSLGLTNLFGNLAAQGGLNSFGIPGAGIYSIAGQDFTVVLRAIAANGKMEVL